MNATFREILDIVSGKAITEEAFATRLFSVDGLSTDTRTVRQGNIFLSLKGERFDGNDFLEKALQEKAGLLIADSKEKLEALKHYGIPSILVENTLAALHALAHAKRKKCTGKVIVLTGSNGKSTTKEMIATILRSSGTRFTATPENENNLIGLPKTLLNASESDEVILLEAGMNAYGEIAALTAVADPDIGVILNVGPAHIGYFGSLENVLKAKWELADGMKKNAQLLLNADDPLLKKAGSTREEARYFGRNTETGKVGNIRIGKGETWFTLETNEKSYEVKLPLFGAHFIANALAAIEVSSLLGIAKEDAINSLAGMSSVKNRMAISSLKRWELINDAYNANPASMKAGLETMFALKNGLPSWYILGDMNELGDLEESFHRNIGRFIAEKLKTATPSRFIFVGEKGRWIGETLLSIERKSRAFFCADYKEAAQILKQEEPNRARLYVKASNGTKLYKIAEELAD